VALVTMGRGPLVHVMCVTYCSLKEGKCHLGNSNKTYGTVLISWHEEFHFDSH
jgi:hypothetical protein